MHIPDSRLPPVPAAATTVTALAECMVERVGLDPAKLSVLLDPANPEKLSAALVDAAEQATDVLLFYYVGHGLVSPRGELHLATRATLDLTRGVPAYQALPYSVVTDVLARCRARLVVVILDCCFSGRASIQDLRQHGAFLLASAGYEESAWAPPGQSRTTFTGALIELLADGEPSAPPWMTLSHVYQCLDRTLDARKAPRPHRQATDKTDQLPLVPNRGYREPAPSRLPGAVPDDGFSPYRGLAAFGQQDADLFFGRDDMICRLRDRLAAVPEGPLMVSGPSGSGKSSLLQAGLIPALRGVEPARRIVTITPGGDPLEQLGRVSGSPAAELRELVSADPARFADLFQDAIPPLLVVDQFEELFTAGADETTRRLFIEALCAASRPRGDVPAAAQVIITVRADFDGYCAAYPILIGALEQHVVVGPMNADQLREAIEQPAQRAGLALQDGLAELLLEDLQATDRSPATLQSGVLPLLSHALLETWQHREGLVLTLAAYRATGGISQALARSADLTLGGLGDEEKDCAKQMLLRLVHVGDGTDDTRRRTRLSDLLPGRETARYDSYLRALNQFVAARLVTADEGAAQIAHEALIRAWPQLRMWLDEDRVKLLVRQQLAQDAETWQHAGADPAYLYTGSRLAAVRTATGEGAGTRTARRKGVPPRTASQRIVATGLSAQEQTFIAASIRREHRRTRRTRQVIATLTILLLLALTAGGYAVKQGRSATSQRDAAIARQLASEASGLGDFSLAAQLSLAAYRISPVNEAKSTLLSILTRPIAVRLLGHSAQVSQLAYSASGRFLASASIDQTVRIWDVSAPGRPRPLKVIQSDSTADFVAWHRNLLVTPAATGIALWDATDPARPRRLADLTCSTIYKVALSQDGRILAASFGSGVQLWDVADPMHARTLARLPRDVRDPVAALAFSPNGDVLATAPLNSAVQLWDIAGPHGITPLSTLHLSYAPRALLNFPNVLYLAFSPDGRTLAGAASANQETLLWDVTDRRHPLPLPPIAGFKVAVGAVQFTPSGGMLAIGLGNGSVALEDMANRRHPASLTTLTSHGGPIVAAVFSPDGDTLATGANDHNIRLWDVTAPTGSAADTLTGYNGGIHRVTFRPDGKVAAISTSDNTTTLWDTRNPFRPLRLKTLASKALWGIAAFSPSGRTLATGYGTSVILWNVSIPAATVPVRTLLGPSAIAPAFGTLNYALSAAFSSDGHLLATGYAVADVVLWDVADPAHARFLGFLRGIDGLYAQSLAFSPRGHLLAVGGNNTTHFYDVTDPVHPREVGALPGNYQGIDQVTFRPDGKILATATGAGTVALWDVTNPAKPHLLSSISLSSGNSPGSVPDVAFSSDGRTIAFPQGSAVRLVDVTDPAHPADIATLTGHTAIVRSVAFRPRGDILASGSDDKTLTLQRTSLPWAAQYICETSGTPLTRAEWQAYIHDLAYDPPCQGQ